MSLLENARTEARSRELILDLLAEQAQAIFVRAPMLDPLCPQTSDADVLAFGPVDCLQPLRLNLPARPGTLPIDVIWLPAQMLDDSTEFAAQGLLAHRLLTSTPLFERGFDASAWQASVRAALPHGQHRRLQGFMQMGFLAVREIGITWDCPPLALFWLHTASAAAICALHELAGSLCPNAYTRPFDSLRALPPALRGDWEARLSRALHLDVNPLDLIEPLQKLHASITARYPEPVWPREMRNTTRCEYRYFLDGAELSWRIAVAREMIAGGDLAQAVYYLRFWAYSLARAPMVRACAEQGEDVSYVRPERAMGRALRQLCPDILEMLNDILGAPQIDVELVRASLREVQALRETVMAGTVALELPEGAIPAWAPAVKKPLATARPETSA